jgi:Fur family ferric uptake transcriptional regulator
MHESRRPVSHGEVAEALGPDGLDRATVYRNLMDLVEAGILMRTDLGDHIWRFELRGEEHGASGHPHFICTDCGAVTCLPARAVKLVPTRKAPRALDKGTVAVQVKGVCDACA